MTTKNPGRDHSARDPAPPSIPSLPAVVLVRPREEGNIGMVARAMANMGLRDLVLVEPAPEIGGTARGFGVGGWPILDSVRRVHDLETALEPFQVAVGTSSARSRPLRHQARIGARDLAETLPKDRRVALVFGPEDKGLTRTELERCNPVVIIPCAPEQPTLNLAQSVLILAYELFLARQAPDAPNRPSMVDRMQQASDGSGAARIGDLDELLHSSAPLVDRLGFDQSHIHRAVMRDLRALMNRAFLSHREAGLLRRLIGRASKALEATRDAVEELGPERPVREGDERSEDGR